MVYFSYKMLIIFKAQSGVLLAKSGGTVQFNEGEDSKVVRVGLAGDGFLKMDTTFTVTLTSGKYRMSISA